MFLFSPEPDVVQKTIVKKDISSNCYDGELLKIGERTYVIEKNGVSTTSGDSDAEDPLVENEPETIYMFENTDDDNIIKIESNDLITQSLNDDAEIEEMQNMDDIDDVGIQVKTTPIRKYQRSSKSPRNEEKKHICNVCSKKFSGRSNLVEHLRLHANIKMYQCPDCSKSFVQSGNLTVHMRVHTKERPYQCSLCPKNYNQSSALKIHVRSHTNERNYVCMECPKRFTNGTDLNKHIRIHDDALKIPCPHCNILFSQKYNLMKHIKRIHMKKKIDKPSGNSKVGN